LDNRGVPRRRSIRLPEYDYAQPGAYFITACAHDRACLFGDIVGTDMRLNEWGEIAAECWRAIPDHFEHVTLDEYVIMPNHVHGILVIEDDWAGNVRATHASPVPPRGPQPRSIGAIVGSFKSATARRINDLRGTPDTRVWHRNYYEHVIRSEESLRQIRQYIADNPIHWADDRENPEWGRP